jgi:quercetin dioxygenase-like cupin family protein
MSFHDLSALTPNEMLPGFFGKFIHADDVTVATWEIKAGAELPPHSHPEVQITLMLAGRFELTVGDETRVVEAGAYAVIPGGVSHAARALTDCRVLDVFQPARPNYRNG